MAITLRPISAADTDLYKETRLRALEDTPSAFGSTYAREVQFTDAMWNERIDRMASDHAIGYLAMEDSQACGLVLAFPSKEDAALIKVISMWVAPTHRRHGVGTLLIDGIKRWAEARSARELRLMVTSNNQSALDFYLRNGFSLTGNTEPYPNDPALLEREMLCPLSAPTPEA
jgi:GNAT superfamily N-acetyltransferase